MSGQALPPRIVEPFAKNAAGPYITNPFPVPSQISVTPGAASLNDGFPPLCFADPASGGVLPSGADFNGILFLLSSWIAYLAAGQLPEYDATLQTGMSGYAKGARITQAANPAALWINLIDGNTTDPDTGGAGWVSSVALYATTAPTAGTHTDNMLSGPSDYILDVDTTAGDIVLNGFVAQRDGQRVTLTNIGANNLTIGINAGSAGNQVRGVGNIMLTAQYADVTIQYSQTLGKWVQV